MHGSDSAVETVAEYGENPKGVVKRWTAEIDLAEKQYREGSRDWYETGDSIIARYRDERPDADDYGRSDRQFNVLWANVQLMAPALYTRPPKPVVARRVKHKDKIGRAASEVLERATDYALEESGFHEGMKLAVLDRLLVGRGQLWVRYVPHMKQVEPRIAVTMVVAEDGASEYQDEEGGVVDAAAVQLDDDGLFISGDPEDELDYEEVVVDHINWRDFYHSPARTWSEVRWVARREYMTREQLVERFGEEIGNAVPLDFTPGGVDKDSATHDFEAFKKATVYEIWDKTSRTVIWLCKGYSDGPLDQVEDPLNLRGFFPCVRPLSSTVTSNTLVPVPDYVQYQDQAEELDLLTTRIAILTSAVKVAGVYNAESKADLQRMVDEGDNVMIPVEGWASFMQGGGTQGNMQFLPLETIAAALIQLYNARDRVKNDLYEISGISDVLRGSTDARETAAAQRIKGRFGTLRISDHQREVQRFARDVVAIMAEVIAEQFDPETVRLMADSAMPDRLEVAQAQQLVAQAEAAQEAGRNIPATVLRQAKRIADSVPFEDAMELLQSDGLRCFKLDIETDSTISVDQEEDKRSRIEFITASTNYLSTAAQLASAVPQMKPLLLELLQFGVQGFPQARPLEQAFDDMAEELTTEEPTPQEVLARAQKQFAESVENRKVEYGHQEKMAELQLDQQQAAMEARNKERELFLEAREQAVKEQSVKIDKALALVEEQRKDREDMRQTLQELNQALAGLGGVMR